MCFVQTHQCCCTWNICQTKNQKVAADLRPVARRLRPALNLLDRVLPGVWIFPGHQHWLKTAHEPCVKQHTHTRHGQTHSEGNSRAVRRRSSTDRSLRCTDKAQKASHGQRWAWPGSPHARRWRAIPPRCTRSRRKRWSGGPRPG